MGLQLAEEWQRKELLGLSESCHCYPLISHYSPATISACNVPNETKKDNNHCLETPTCRNTHNWQDFQNHVPSTSLLPTTLKRRSLPATYPIKQDDNDHGLKTPTCENPHNNNWQDFQNHVPSSLLLPTILKRRSLPAMYPMRQKMRENNPRIMTPANESQ